MIALVVTLACLPLLVIDMFQRSPSSGASQTASSTDPSLVVASVSTEDSTTTTVAVTVPVTVTAPVATVAPPTTIARRAPTTTTTTTCDALRHHQHQPGTPQRRRVSGIALRSVKPVETGQRIPVTDTAADSSSPTVPDGRHGVPLVARNSPLTRGKRHESSRSSSPNVFSPAPGGARGLGARASKQDQAFSVCFRFGESHHLHAASTGEGCRRRVAVIA